jgi:hypothetical protein
LEEVQEIGSNIGYMTGIGSSQANIPPGYIVTDAPTLTEKRNYEKTMAMAAAANVAAAANIAAKEAIAVAKKASADKSINNLVDMIQSPEVVSAAALDGGVKLSAQIKGTLKTLENVYGSSDPKYKEIEKRVLGTLNGVLMKANPNTSYGFMVLLFAGLGYAASFIPGSISVNSAIITTMLVIIFGVMLVGRLPHYRKLILACVVGLIIIISVKFFTQPKRSVTE